MRRARQLPSLPSSSDDDADQPSHSEGTSNLSSSYNVEEEEDEELESSASEQRGNFRRNQGDDSVSNSDISYDSDESAISGDVRVGRGYPDPLTRRRRNPTVRSQPTAESESEFVYGQGEDAIDDEDDSYDDDDETSSEDNEGSSDEESDDDADFADGGRFDDEGNDEDEEEENILMDLSERLGGAPQNSSIRPLLQVVRTIIQMEKAVSSKTDALKALETRLQTETVINGDADGAIGEPQPTQQQTSSTAASSGSNNGESTPSLRQQIGEIKAFLVELQPMLRDQWAIAARLVHTEFLRSSDAYSQSLDLQDRVSFERVARILIGREELFEIIDSHLLVGNMEEEIPRYAAFIAYMVSEGTREPVFGATSQDLFPIVLTEPSRLKRIVALTTLFTLLDRDYEEDRTINELLNSDVPRAMLMRMKEYCPQLMEPFKQFSSSHLMDYYTTTSADEGDMTSLLENNDNNNDDDDDNALPHLSLPDAELSSHGAAPSSALLASLATGPYIPKLGDIVTRGPDWSRAEQDHGSKRGVIMAILSKGADGVEEEIDADNNDEPLEGESAQTYTVLVRWDPPDDFVIGNTKRRVNKSLRGKLFKYRCGGYTHREVVSLPEYRRIYMFDLNTNDFKLDEFYLMGAICGLLAQRKGVIPLLVQYRTLETMLSILQCGQRYGALVQEIVLSRLAYCELDSDEDALKFDWHMAHLQPPAVEKAVKAARAWRELTARGMWVTNGAIAHKTLGSLFVGLGGIPYVLAIANSFPSVVSHRYGAGLVLQQLAKFELLHEVMSAGEGLLPQVLTTLQRLLENTSADIKQGVAHAYYWGLSFVPFLRQFDADNCIAGLAKELRVSLGMQGNSSVLLPADQRPVEIDMYVNKNAHLINMYLRSVFVYLSSHLLQLGIVLFRRNRSSGGSGGLASLAGDSQFLPRDENYIESVIAALHQADEVQDTNDSEHTDTSSIPRLAGPKEYLAASLISPEQWKPFRTLVDDYRLHELLLLIIHTFETHRKRDVRMCALNVLYVLSVAPCTRAPIAECFVESPDSVDC